MDVFAKGESPLARARQEAESLRAEVAWWAKIADERQSERNIFRRKAERAEAEVERLRALLSMLYDKWENGIPCHESDDDGPFIGNAVNLSGEEEHAILAALDAKGGK